MTDATGNGGAPANPQAGAQQQTQMQVRVVGQYIKDLSFESPNIHKLMSGAPDNPQLNLDLNVHPESVVKDTDETELKFKARAESKSAGVIYELELAYAGVFRIENAPPEALEVMLNVNCPALLFPFLRRIVADLTREGGFPPLLLDPVDFGSLFMRKKAVEAGHAHA